MSTRLKFTAEIEALILAGIRAGAFPHVAAEAAGVPREVFHAWLHRGRTHGGRPFGPFFRKVRQAQAQSRLKAEIEARDLDVRFWLRYGPGRESSSNPGWTSTVKPTLASDGWSSDARTIEEWHALAAQLLQILSPFPEARAALVQVLTRDEAEA